MLRWISGFFSVLLLSLTVACGGGGDGPSGNVVEVAQRDSRFSILVEAVQAAGLADTLSGSTQVTVLAPTNDAFAALLAELGVSKDQLISNKTLLQTVLKYHVLSGRVPSNALPIGKAVTPVGGGFFKIDRTGSNLMVMDGRNRTSKIVQQDIQASNGLIHAVDRVLLPADKNIVQTAIANPDFSVLVEAVTAAGLVDSLAGTGPFTVFAPTNAAFSSLLAELGLTKAQLLEDKALLSKVLTYHVVSGLILKAEVPLNAPVKTVEGETFTVGADLAITDQRSRRANIVATDTLTSNGVIHLLDKVILPSP